MSVFVLVDDADEGIEYSPVSENAYKGKFNLSQIVDGWAVGAIGAYRSMKYMLYETLTITGGMATARWAAAGLGTFSETISISGKEGSTMAYNFTGATKFPLRFRCGPSNYSGCAEFIFLSSVYSSEQEPTPHHRSRSEPRPHPRRHPQ